MERGDRAREELAAAVADLQAYFAWAREAGAELAAARTAGIADPTATATLNPTATPNPTTTATANPLATPTPHPTATANPLATPPLPLTPTVSLPVVTLEAVRAELGECTRCKLHRGRTNIVFGVGNPRARLMFVGEAPGEDEDLQGEPFVGKAGQLLTRMIEAMDLRRSDVYICNTVKCRPPGNRNPETDELLACEPFLKGQLAAVRPEAIVTLGKFAAQALLRDASPISRLRGRWREYEGIPVMPTFHPAYLLRSPAEKGKVWADLQQVMQKLGLERKAGP